jgi:hypothetical protein
MDADRLTADYRPTLAVRMGLAVLGALVICYMLVFVITGAARWPSALLDALINVVPLGLWGGVFFALNRRWLLDRPLAWQAPLQLLAAGAFAFLWYFTVTILLGWRSGNFAGSFSVRPFSSIAFVWQMFQGVVAYALVAAFAMIDALVEALRELRQRPDARADDRSSSGAGERRILVRRDDELVPVAVEDIVALERAGDYVQLMTAGPNHLTRRSLAELETLLPPKAFVRIHRSCLINLDALEVAEPIGGGRMRVRLRGGIELDSSRSGARLLRERAG